MHGRTSKSILSLGILAATLAVASPPVSAQAVITLPTAVQEELRKLPQADAPAAPLRRIQFDISTGSKSEKTYERLDNGLWGVTERLPRRGDTAIARAVTLLGIVELTSAMDVVSETTLALPAGKGFVPYGVTTTSQTSLSRNTKSLTGDLQALMKPEPNARVSYVHATEGLLTISGGLRKMTKALNYETDITCSVAAAAESKSLHPALKGAYLPVTCDAKERGGSASTRTFAYLADSGIYVLLELTTGSRRETYKISGVEYAN